MRAVFGEATISFSRGCAVRFAFCFALCLGALGTAGCVLEDVGSTDLSGLPPPCAPGWMESADGTRCLRPGEDAGLSENLDAGGFDAATSDVGTSDAGLPDAADSGEVDMPCFDPTSGVPNPNTPAPDHPVINEYLFGHAQIDGLNNHYYEFIEIYAAPGADLRDLTFVDVNANAGGNLGIIEVAVTVEKTNRAGFWRSCLGWMDEENAFNQASSSLFLVRGFTATVGEDLDTDDDGTLDFIPWNETVDAVSFEDGDATGDVFYAQPILTNDGYPGHPISAARQLASRVADGADTDAEADWRKGGFGGFGLPSVAGEPRSTEAWITPGAPNRIQP